MLFFVFFWSQPPLDVLLVVVVVVLLPIELLPIVGLLALLPTVVVSVDSVSPLPLQPATKALAINAPTAVIAANLRKLLISSPVLSRN